MKAWPLALIVALGACDGAAPATGFVLDVTTNLAAPSEIDTVRIVASGTGDAVPYEVTHSLGKGEGLLELPNRFGVFPQDKGDGRFHIEVTGWLSSDPVSSRVVRTATVGFVKGKTMLLAMPLLRICQGKVCDPSFTCNDRRDCEPDLVDGATLSVYKAGQPAPIGPSSLPMDPTDAAPLPPDVLLPPDAAEDRAPPPDDLLPVDAGSPRDGAAAEATPATPDAPALGPDAPIDAAMAIPPDLAPDVVDAPVDVVIPPPLCGNGHLDPGETCDPMSSTACPMTCPRMGCSIQGVVGSGCTAACMETSRETMCKGGDSCCPSGCNAVNDGDCNTMCGNGVIEGDETCEPGVAGGCPTSCPMNGCMGRQLQTGADACHAQCVNAGLVTQCKAAADGCCPAACNSLSSNPNFDADCTPRCGNGVIESGEICDSTGTAATDCTQRAAACVTDADHVSTSTGSVAACTFGCTVTQRQCSGNLKDGFCPSACAASPVDPTRQDADCLAGAGQPCGAGTTCGGGLFCTDGVCCTQQNCGQCQQCSSTGQCAPVSGEQPAGSPQGSLCNPSTSTCVAGVCKLKDGGTGCSTDSSCVSGMCIGGVCCKSECRAGTGSDLLCRATACMVGTGACVWPGSNVACTSPLCMTGTPQSSTRLSCDGAGHCSVTMSTSCGAGIRCNSITGVCPAACSSDADCVSSFHCNLPTGACTSTCTAETNAAFCARLGKNCGTLSGTDNCGVSRTVSSCGTCAPPQSCGAGNPGTANVCGCTAESNATFCARLNANCGSLVALDNCATMRTVSCGTCGGNLTCGGSGVANVCGCTPQSDASFCASNGKNCGSVTGADNCGLPRTVASCGTCGTFDTCGGGGTANVCGCLPSSDATLCSLLGKNCGSVFTMDNCGQARTITCGSCPAGKVCKPSGVCG